MSARSSRGFPSPSSLSLCAVDLAREESEQLAVEEYRRALKGHFDPRREDGELGVEDRQQIERAVSEWMEVYIQTHFRSSLSAKKPFTVWKSLKDAEALIRLKLVTHKREELRKTEEDGRAVEARERARSAKAFRRWKAQKKRESLRKRKEEMEQKRKANDDLLRRRIQSAEEFTDWLHRKASESRERASLHRKHLSLQARFHAAQQQKASERAQLSYRHWLSRKKYESLCREQKQESPPEHREKRPVLMAYSVNRERRSHDSGEFSSDRRWEGSETPAELPDYLYSEDEELSESDYYND